MSKDEGLVVKARQRFFSKQVYQKSWTDQMKGHNEKKVKEVIELLGYEYKKDFVSQYPIGERFVLDFAFVPLKVAIEVDGREHNNKKQRASDRKRDSYLFSNGWVSLRIKDKDFFDNFKMSIYKNLIKEIVEERQQQYNNGELYHIDIPNFKDEDYD